MKEKTAATRRSGAAARFIDARLAVGRVAFPLADLVKETGLSITAARNQLLRLGNRVVRPAQKHQFFLGSSEKFLPGVMKTEEPQN